MRFSVEDGLKISTISGYLGFGVCVFFNIYLSYLTLYHIKNMCSTYKKMIVYFSITGIFFSGFDLWAKPFAHNYTGALVFFSLGGYGDISQFSVALWSGFFTSIISFISIQFIYRCLCLFNGENTAKFNRVPSIIWMSYPLFIASVYCYLVYFLCQPDPYSDDYVRTEISKNYNWTVESLPRFIMMPYDTEGNPRWKNMSFIISAIILINIPYFVIIYCGLKMHFNMANQLKKFSMDQRKLQRQFFKALILQCLGPTIFLVLPAAPIILSPMLPPSLNFSISWQTGWLYPLIQIFPPFDSISFMIVVTEYRRTITNQLRRVMPKSSKIQPTITLEINGEPISRMASIH